MPQNNQTSASVVSDSQVMSPHQTAEEALSPGAAAVNEQAGAWASDEKRQENEQFFLEQGKQAGISDEDVEELYLDMRQGRVLLADVLGMTPGQMDAMSYRANELLRNNEPRKALAIYLALYELNPLQFQYQRGAAQCFQAIKQYGFACGYYRLAMATLGRKDFVCMAMIGECLLWLDDKETSIRALDEALLLGSEDKQEQIFVERAKAFRLRLLLGIDG